MNKPVFLVGEAYGENEAKINAGFVGASGLELLRMLNDADFLTLTGEDFALISRYFDTGDPRYIDNIWRMHPEVYRTNVFNRHPRANKLEEFCGPKATALAAYPALIPGKFVRAEFQSEIDRLGDEILEADPNLIICLGNAALWALTGSSGISKVRGTVCLSTHCVSGFKLLPTYHPSAVLRQWELRPTTVFDFIKASREAAYSEIRKPKREIWIEPTLEDLDEFYRLHIHGCSILAVDIETSGEQITEIGFAPSPQVALVLPFKDARKKAGNYWPTIDAELLAWGFVRRICEDREIAKVFQNGPYDIAFLLRGYDIKVYGAAEDTMFLAHALQPEQLKGLGYLGSIYTDEGAWKNERKFKTTIKKDE